MGHLQAPGAIARGIRRYRAERAQCEINRSRNRPPQNTRLPQIRADEICRSEEDKLYWIRRGRTDRRTASDLNGRGSALHIIRRFQRNCAFGLHVWRSDPGFRYSRLQAAG